MEAMLTVKQVAERLHISLNAVYRLKDSRDGLKAYRVGRCIRFKAQDVEEYLERNQVKPAEPTRAMPGITRFKYTPGMRVV